MEEYMNTIRINLLGEMGEKGWTNMMASIQCDVSERSINYILSGKAKDIKLSTIAKIAEGIGKPVSAIINPKETRKSDNEEFLKKVCVDLKRQLQKIELSL